MTDAEIILWSRLRGDQMNRHRFRRQYPVGPYIADFVCVPAHLIVEVDGDTHGTATEIAHDRCRAAYVRERGWRTERFTNRDIYKNLNGVLDRIADLLPPPAAAATAAASTSPAGGGGKRPHQLSPRSHP